MIFVPYSTDKFWFVRVSSLRAAQLIKGCSPRVSVSRKHTSTAQREVLEGKVPVLPRVEKNAGNHK